MNFHQALISAYIEFPCQVLPNALWKTMRMVDQYEVAFSYEDNRVTHLKAWGADSLYLLWDLDRRSIGKVKLPIDSIKFALLHQDYVDGFSSERFSKREMYFRLIYRHEPKEPLQLSSGLKIVDVDVNTEAGLVADLINRCYPNIRVTSWEVESWATHPVFSPDLWIWVVDEDKDMPVGAGIGEVDRTIAEGSLEWIQVLPAYRGRGIGTGIVHELLGRLRGRVAFTTVSGAVNNPANPEALYRRCGFEGEDRWWVLRE